MKPKHLAIALGIVGVLIAGVVLLLIPEDDAAMSGGTPSAQEAGPEGLPKFRAGNPCFFWVLTTLTSRIRI